MSELAVNASEVNALITTTISSTRAQAVNIRIPKFTLEGHVVRRSSLSCSELAATTVALFRAEAERGQGPERKPSSAAPNHPVGLYRQPALPPAPLDRTKFPPSEFIAEERKKFRAVFAKHNEREQPIPLHAIKEDHTDDSDMDLLLPDALAQQASQQRGITLAASGAAHTQVAAQADYPAQKYQSRLDPNQKLDSCCRKQGVSQHCQQVCNFDNFTDRSLVTAILTNQCPGPELGRAFDCATAKVDHSDCCLRANVHLHNGGQCMPWCRTHLPAPPNVLAYVACLPVFNNIKQCYREYQYTHPNIYGD
ncbi:Protein Y53F4B.25 [Aphelenchoides avenae]|nr:Protein Y53F4B.25 [Aphelenchus avenae]